MSDDTAAIDGPALVRRLRELVFAWAGDPGNKEPLTSRDIQDTFKCLQAAADRLEHSTNERIRLTGELLAAKDTLRAHLEAPAVAPPALRLHRCKVCGTRWLLWPDAVHGGGWNLLDHKQRPGGCCDNVLMGEQIEHLRDIPLQHPFRQSR